MKRLCALVWVVSALAWGESQVNIEVCVPEATYTAGGCTISYLSCAGDEGSYSDMVVPKECEARDINRIADALENASVREKYVDSVRHYFLDAPQSDGQGSGFGRGDLNRGFTFTALNLGTGNGTGSGDFAATFGTTYDASRLGSNRRAGGNPIGSMGEWMSTAKGLGDGASLAYAVANGSLGASLAQAGETFSVGWKAILYGGEGDAMADAYIKNLRATEVAVLQDFHDHIVSVAAQVAKESEQVLVASEVTRVRTGKNIRQARQVVQKAVAHLQSGRDRLAPASAQITTLTRLKVAELSVASGALSRLRQGLVPPAQIQAMDAGLDGLGEAARFEDALGDLQSLSYAAQTDPNPLRRAQMKELLQRHVNDRGLVTAWAAQRPGHLTRFESDTTTARGRRVRQAANRALGTLNHSEKVEIQKAADLALVLARQADLAVGQGNARWADRQLARSRQLLDYATNHARVARYRSQSLSARARQAFGVEGVTSDTFEGNQVVQLANALARHPEMGDPDSHPYAHFYGVTAVQSAVRAAAQDNRAPLLGMLDRGWRLHDYLEGFASGVGVFVVDTVTGVRELVTHPVDSAEAMWDAVVNFERTYAAIRTRVEQVVDAYPTMSTFEKAQLHGQIASEVASLFVGVGALKAGATAPKLTTAFGKLSSVTEKTVEGLTGLRRLQQRGSSLLTAPTRSLRTTLQLGREVRDLPEAFLGLLEHHIKRDRLGQADALQVLKFRDGFSYFIPKHVYDRFRDTGPILGRPDGQFVTTRAAANSLEQVCGQNSLMWEKRLGFPEDHLGHGNDLYRVDLPFKWDYHPHLPRGTEGGAMQALFKYGGETSGGVPEMLIHSPRYVDIVNEGTVTKLHFGPVVE